MARFLGAPSLNARDLSRTPRPTAGVEGIGHSLESGGADRSRPWGLGIEPDYADALIAAEHTDIAERVTWAATQRAQEHM